MSDKPKTFEEWLRANKIILHRTHKLNKVDGAWVSEMKDAWNAAIESRKGIEEFMQEELDKKGVEITRCYKLIGMAQPVIETFKFMIGCFIKDGICTENESTQIIKAKCDMFLKELNGVKDE